MRKLLYPISKKDALGWLAQKNPVCMLRFSVSFYASHDLNQKLEISQSKGRKIFVELFVITIEKASQQMSIKLSPPPVENETHKSPL